MFRLRTQSEDIAADPSRPDPSSLQLLWSTVRRNKHKNQHRNSFSHRPSIWTVPSGNIHSHTNHKSCVFKHTWTWHPLLLNPSILFMWHTNIYECTPCKSSVLFRHSALRSPMQLDLYGHTACCCSFHLDHVHFDPSLFFLKYLSVFLSVFDNESNSRVKAEILVYDQVPYRWLWSQNLTQISMSGLLTGDSCFQWMSFKKKSY